MIGAPLLAVFAFDGPDYVTVLDIVGALLWTLGFYFEAVGDWQLKVFKSNPKNKGKLMTSGLWGLTRHPNYFGDATLWWGFGVMALSMSGGYWTVFGPLMMSLLIVKVSGVALLEKNLKTAKPGYEEYMASTPAFFPNFFKFLGPKSQL
jgi:steroid 5-alpha reductase family enzyme